MLFRRRGADSRADQRDLDLVPLPWRELVTAVIDGGAADRILVTGPIAEPLLQQWLSSGETRHTTTRTIYASLPSPSSGRTDSRLLALFEALTASGINAVVNDDVPAISLNGSWAFRVDELTHTPRGVTVQIGSVSGPCFRGNGQLAPLTWQHLAGEFIDYTGAVVALASDEGTVRIEVGERFGSTAAVVKAVQSSERRAGSDIDFYALGDALGDVPHLITGPAAELVRGVADVDRRLLSRIEVTIHSADLDLAVARLGEQAVDLSPVDDWTFEDLESRSTRHDTRLGPLFLGPAEATVNAHEYSPKG